MISRAAVFASPGQPLELREFSTPTLRDGEALVRITSCTLCGSDLHSISGRRTVPTPTILGHEIVGTITELAGQVADINGEPLGVGDRVCWSIVVTCGKCDRCGRGLDQKCRELFKYGHAKITEQHILSGGLAEHCHTSLGTKFIRLPDSLTDLEAAPASCATSTIAAALRSTRGVEDRSVLIIGAGMLGITASAMAGWKNASRVVVCDPDATRLARAVEFGADDVRAKFDDGEYDVVLECSGNEAAVEAALQNVAIGGELVLVGSVFPSAFVSWDPERIVRRLIQIHGVHNYVPADLAEAIRFLEACHDRFPFASLVSEVFALDDVNRAIEFAAESRPFRVAIQS